MKNIKKTIMTILILVLVCIIAAACNAPAAPTDVAVNPSEGVEDTANKLENSGAQEEQKTGSAEDLFPVTIEDYLGNRVTIEKEPQRIISLSPANTEILFALGLGDKVIGVTEYCNYPEEAAQKEKVSDFDGVNVELVVSKEPDLVISGGYLQEDATQRFNELGITVVSTECLGYDDIFKAIELIGQATGTPDKAAQLADSIKQQVDEIVSKVDNKEKPKVFFIVELSPMYTCGSNTYIDTLIRMAGGQNIVEEENWLQYSLEKLIEQDPDIILNADYAASSEDILAKPEFAGITAVKDGKVFDLDPDIVTRPSPRVVQALEDIYNAINN
ncbi:MAG TPA: cobalamin-binding protein [Clostridiales bacterium]|nr:cobalamin-binding protein [Clostridiales bacterium]